MRSYDDRHGITGYNRAEAETALDNNPPYHNAHDPAQAAYLEDVGRFKGPHTQAILRDLAAQAQAAWAVPNKRALEASHLASRGDPRGERLLMKPAPVWVRAGPRGNFLKFNVSPPGLGVAPTVSAFIPQFQNVEQLATPYYDIPISGPSEAEISGGVRDSNDLYELQQNDRHPRQPAYYPSDYGALARIGETLAHVTLRGNQPHFIINRRPEPWRTSPLTRVILGLPAGGLTPEALAHRFGSDEDYTSYGHSGERIGPTEYRHLFGGVMEVPVPLEAINFAGDLERDPGVENPLTLAHLPNHDFTPDWRKTWLYATTPEGPKRIPHIYYTPHRAIQHVLDEQGDEDPQVAEMESSGDYLPTHHKVISATPKPKWWAK